MLRWGLLPGVWAEKKGQRPLINARAETVATQPAFKESFEQRRCLIPADGFYEWRKDPEGKVPVWFSPPGEPGEELFAFAGHLGPARAKGRRAGDELRADHLPAQRSRRPVHDRMPVVLDRSVESAWIDPDAEAGRPARAPAAGAGGSRCRLRDVGDAVNDNRGDGPHLLDPPMKLF